MFTECDPDVKKDMMPFDHVPFFISESRKLTFRANRILLIKQTSPQEPGGSLPLSKWRGAVERSETG
jgi:hypothetical protein